MCDSDEERACGGTEVRRLWREAEEAGAHRRRAEERAAPAAPPLSVGRRVVAPAAGHVRTMDRYPRLEHELCVGHYIRLTLNDEIGYWDMKAYCGKHDNCTFTRQCKFRPAALLWSWLTDAANCLDKETLIN